VLKRRLTVIAATAMLALSGIIPAHAGPGPNGNNNYELCNAYFNGSSQGQAEKQAHGASFLALEATATAWDAQNDQNEPAESTSESTNEKVQEYCAANGQHP